MSVEHVLKVSKSRKQILKFSFESKASENIFLNFSLQARAEKQKQIRLFFGLNENFETCFWDLLTFSNNKEALFLLPD